MRATGVKRSSRSVLQPGRLAITQETIMKVALIGASGQGGSRLLAELTRRGHQVTAIARNPEKITAGPAVTAKKGDVFDKAGLVQLLRGHDAVVSAVRETHQFERFADRTLGGCSIQIVERRKQLKIGFGR